MDWHTKRQETLQFLTGRGWQKTTDIMRRLGYTSFRPEDNCPFRINVLQKLMQQGKIERTGTKKFLWRLRDTNSAIILPPSSPPPYFGEVEEPAIPEQNGVQEQMPVISSDTNRQVLTVLSMIQAKLEGLDTVTSLQEDKIQRLENMTDPFPGILNNIISEIKSLEEIVLRTTTAKEINVTLPTGETRELKETPHPMLDKVVRMVQGATINGERRRIYPLLIGPAGTGKSFLAEQVSRVLDTDFGHISCSAGMSEGHILGRLLPTGEEGKFTYSRSEFVRIYEDGGVFLFDEVDAADANTLIILNSALANGHLSVPNRMDNPTAVKHEDFICIAAANTFGTGADRQYVGRNQLDEAFLDRFRIGQVIVNYDPNLEAFLCPDDELRTRFQKYRRNCVAAKVRRVISSRAMKDAYLGKLVGLSDQELDDALMGGWKEDEIQKAKGSY